MKGIYIIMKKILIFALAVLIYLVCTSCSSVPAYSDSVSVEQLMSGALDAVGPAEDYMDGTDNYYAYYFEGRDGAEHIDECRMMFHVQETNVNEVSIFCADSVKNASAVEALARAYLAEQTDYLRSFAQNYSPEDLKKIDNADVAVMGRYVVCYILTPEDETAALAAVKTALTVE